MTLNLHLVDAFADRAFSGNPAAVVLLDAPRPDAWMQQVATEMNQAETAFLLRQDQGFGLRWFTPASEVDLCGHATLASAHYLWQTGEADRGASIGFDTRSGRLTATAGDEEWITLDFPGITSHPVDPPADLLAALGTAPHTVLYGAFDLLCVVDSATIVRQLAPDLAAIARWPMRGVTVTAPGDRDNLDFVSRCFFPALGIPEDPVTGSAHCALAMYWSGVLGRAALVGWQASRRGGLVRCEVDGDRVRLTGRAVTTLTGHLVA